MNCYHSGRLGTTAARLTSNGAAARGLINAKRWKKLLAFEQLGQREAGRVSLLIGAWTARRRLERQQACPTSINLIDCGLRKLGWFFALTGRMLSVGGVRRSFLQGESDEQTSTRDHL